MSINTQYTPKPVSRPVKAEFDRKEFLLEMKGIFDSSLHKEMTNLKENFSKQTDELKEKVETFTVEMKKEVASAKEEAALSREELIDVQTKMEDALQRLAERIDTLQTISKDERSEIKKEISNLKNDIKKNEKEDAQRAYHIKKLTGQLQTLSEKGEIEKTAFQEFMGYVQVAATIATIVSLGSAAIGFAVGGLACLNFKNITYDPYWKIKQPDFTKIPTDIQCDPLGTSPL